MAERRNIINFYVRRPKKSRQKEDEEDRLSSLPDEIITNILSRLSINSAAATSVLSRRWRHLWTTVHRLDFCVTNSTTTAIVDHIFSQLTSPKFTQVYLYLSQLYPLPNPNAIKSWFSEICRRNVEHILIEAWYGEDGDADEDDDFVVPSFVLTTQSLMSLSLSGQHPPKLAKAYVDLALSLEYGMQRFAGDEDYARGMSKFVRGLSSVRHLELKVDGGSNIFVDFHSMDDEALPIFYNLIRAELTLENINSNHWTKLLLFLQCFPQLKHLKVDLGRYDLPRLRQKWCAPDFMPNCLSSQLKTIYISGFIGTVAELELLGYILSCALVLEKLVVKAYYINDTKEEYHFCLSLFKLPRRSSTCVIKFWGSSITASSTDNKKKYLRSLTCRLHL